MWTEIKKEKLLLLPDGVIYSLFDISPQKGWSARSLSAHEPDMNAVAELKSDLEDLTQTVDTPESRDKIKDFGGSVIKAMQEYSKKGSAWLKDYLKQTEQIFVLGHGRSGGTYLLTEMMRVHGMDYRNFELMVLHDFYFQDIALTNWHRDPLASDRFVFELFCLFEWYRRFHSDAKVLFKKQTTLFLGIPLLQKILGSSARFIWPIRHPMMQADSSRREQKLSDEEAYQQGPDGSPSPFMLEILSKLKVSPEVWKTSSHQERLFFEWCGSLELLLERLDNKFEFQFVSYPEIPALLDKESKSLGQNSANISSFNAKERDWNDQWPPKDHIEEKIQSYASRFEEKGIKFPALKLY